jgi:hypothetical protein
VQTIIFENTNFKTDKMFKGLDGPSAAMKEATLQMSQLGFAAVKPEDSDLKLDFAFEPTDMQQHHVEDKGLGRPIPAAADDLNQKIASVKKVWETESMSPGPDGSGGVAQPGFGSQGFVVTAEDKSFSEVTLGEDPASVPHAYDKSDLGAPAVAKVRPQQQPQHQQQQPHIHQQHLPYQQQLEAGRNAAYSRLLGSASGLTTLHSPPSILSQPPSLYQAFQMDPSRGVASPIYSAYPAMNAPSVLSAADLFGPPPSSSQYRMPTTNATGQFAGGQSQASQVMLSQSLMSSGGMKPPNQIGPIGSKAGNAFQQGGLGSLPSSGASPMLISYDSTVNPINYLQRPGQTAFYQTLASNQVRN